MSSLAMLWYDDDKKRTLEQKIERASEHYAKKYGAYATICYVNPALLPDGDQRMGRMLLRPARTVLPNHFWMGVEGATQ